MGFVSHETDFVRRFLFGPQHPAAGLGASYTGTYATYAPSVDYIYVKGHWYQQRPARPIMTKKVQHAPPIGGNKEDL
jgi:hypothetical protein